MPRVLIPEKVPCYIHSKCIPCNCDEVIMFELWVLQLMCTYRVNVYEAIIFADKYIFLSTHKLSHLVFF